MVYLKSQIPENSIHLGSMIRRYLQNIKNTAWEKHRIRITNAQAIELALGEYFGAISAQSRNGGSGSGGSGACGGALGKFAIFIHDENPRAVQVGNTQLISSMRAHREASKAQPEAENTQAVNTEPQPEPEHCRRVRFNLN